jgi:gliding motility-associated-like protein
LAYRVQWDAVVNDLEHPSELSAGTYRFTITDQNNCTYTDQVSIEEPDLVATLENDCSGFNLLNNIYIPNAFSPNNDGNNEEFRIFANQEEVAIIHTMRIFDRWGNLLFEVENFTPDDRTVAWDGTHRGKRLSAGVYLYSLELENILGQRSLRNGSLTLIR